MLAYLLYALFFISCLILIVTVLLQPGKADAGALFTSNISSTAFGPRGTQSVLSRITISAAAIFMISALLLSFPAITGNISVLQTTTESPANVPPATTTANTTAAPSNANTAESTADSNSGNATVNTNVNK